MRLREVFSAAGQVRQIKPQWNKETEISVEDDIRTGGGIR
jgi:hypothetical protein